MCTVSKDKDKEEQGRGSTSWIYVKFAVNELTNDVVEQEEELVDSHV